MSAQQPTLQDAFALHGQGRLSEAARLYEAIIAREPDNAEARLNLGVILLSAGRANEAKPLMKRALQLKPNEPGYLVNYLGALMYAGDFAEALDLSRRALDRQPRNADFLYVHALSLQKLDRLEEARARFVALLRLAPGHRGGRLEYAVTLARLGKQEEPLRLAEALIAEYPTYPNPYLVRANIRADRGEIGLAVADYERALALQPNAYELWQGYGRALEKLGQYDRALAAFDRALALRPNDAAGLIDRGDALMRLDRAPEAFACYDQAAATADGDDRKLALTARALALVQAGRTEEARAELRRVVELYDNPGEAWHALADLTKFEAGDPGFAAMETKLANSPAKAGAETLALHFALGKAYLDIGDSKRAFEHLNASNRQARAQIVHDADAQEARMAAIAKAFPAEIFARFAGAGSRAAAPIFVVGMPRSGTSLIEQILASHPAIHGAGELPALPAVAAEIGVPAGVAALTAERLAALGDAYVRRVGAPPAGKSVWVDKFPGNFAYAGLIRLILPEARIIHSRRDPVDTCLSCYAIRFSSPALSFAYDLTELGRYYRDYLGLMAHWRSVLPATHFLEVDYEAITDDLEREARRMLDFLGLPWDPACLEFHRARRAVHTASVNQVRQPIYRTSVGRWRAHADELAPLLQALGAPPV